MRSLSPARSCLTLPLDVCGVPSSLNELVPNPSPPDSRTLDKLFDGVNLTTDDRHMWLVPLLPSSHNPNQSRNTVYIYFDAPVALSAMKIWNYSKTPSRGVQTMQVQMDDRIIFDGVVRQAPSAPIIAAAQAKMPRGSPAVDALAHTVMFCAHPLLVERETPYIYREAGQQDVLLVDERRFMNQPSALAAPSIPHGKTHAQVAAAASAGKTPGALRPKTMAGRGP
jgi:hypothetical protein